MPQPETEKEHDRITFRSLRVDDCNQMLTIRNEIVLEGVPFGNRKEKTKETGFFKKDGIERVRMEMMLDAE